MKERIAILAAAALLVSAAVWQAKPVVTITAPAEGATVSSPVKITLQASGVEIVAATEERPGTGHHHLFVDTDVAVVNDTIARGVTGIQHLGRGQTEFTFDSITPLAPGKHRIIAVVADWRHSPLKPWVADTVTFTVK